MDFLMNSASAYGLALERKKIILDSIVKVTCMWTPAQ